MKLTNLMTGESQNILRGSITDGLIKECFGRYIITGLNPMGKSDKFEENKLFLYRAGKFANGIFGRVRGNSHVVDLIGKAETISGGIRITLYDKSYIDSAEEFQRIYKT